MRTPLLSLLVILLLSCSHLMFADDTVSGDWQSIGFPPEGMTWDVYDCAVTDEGVWFIAGFHRFAANPYANMRFGAQWLLRGGLSGYNIQTKSLNECYWLAESQDQTLFFTHYAYGEKYTGDTIMYPLIAPMIIARRTYANWDTLAVEESSGIFYRYAWPVVDRQNRPWVTRLYNGQGASSGICSIYCYDAEKKERIPFLLGTGESTLSPPFFLHSEPSGLVVQYNNGGYTSPGKTYCNYLPDISVLNETSYPDNAVTVQPLPEGYETMRIGVWEETEPRLIWMGSGKDIHNDPQTGFGLVSYHLDTGERRHYTRASGHLPSDTVWALRYVESQNALWIGTDAGLVIYDIGRDSWSTLTTDNSPLISNIINSIKVGGDGVMWLATRAGLMSFEYDAVNGVAKGEAMFPAATSLQTAAWPNPFNPATTISFTLPRVSRATLTIYDVSGQTIARPVDNQMMNAGRHEVVFDGSGLASGVYLWEVKAGDLTGYGRCTLAK